MPDNRRDRRSQRQAAQRRDAVVDLLLGRLLHDLKQPLGVARMVAQSVEIDLQKRRLDLEALPTSMVEITGAVDEVVLRLDQLRAAFARHDEAPPTTGTADLNATCEAAAARAEPEQADVALSLVLLPDVGSAAIDAGALEQAIRELLDNALRAAAESEHPAVELTTAAKGDNLVVVVCDNGPGVRPDTGQQIFQPFFSTQPGTAGVGLPLARALVSTCGGNVELTRSDRHGCVFQIVVPRRGA